MNVVMIIPTGIGAEIGGHAGDGNAVARLLGGACDNLILHPNVVNASDINEMPSNSLYVEGSMLDRFLRGEIELQRVMSNKVLVAVNKPVKNETINAVSAARVTLGLDAEIIELKTPLEMYAKIALNGTADGSVYGWKELIIQVKSYNFDALAITTQITYDKDIALNYLRNGGVNPWGAVEAKVSKLISNAINKPVAHAPTETDIPEMLSFTEVVDPRMAAEVVSNCYLHCVLKGLHKAPRIGKGISVNDIHCLVTPINCVGPPHKACLAAGIPIIAVRENKTVCNDPMPDEFIVVENYLEAVGVLIAMKVGTSIESVHRPIEKTRVRRSGVGC